MPSLPIHWIEARAHVHATEDEGRVQQALDTACPGGPAARARFEGHFGNLIVRLSRRLARSEEIRETWALWGGAGLLSAIASEAEARLDEGGVLHFRVDKQAAFAGALALARSADAIDVLVRIEAHPATTELRRRVVHGLLSGGR